MKRTSSRFTSTTTKADHRSSQPLDLSTVRTTNESIPRTRKRIFGLQEAPIYHPTSEEFKDPIQYIQKIKPEAEQYGIIKIVPPKDYEPGFCLDTEIFRFRTRIQKMNSMEGETRAKLNYMDKIQKFHRVHGKPLCRLPVLDKRPVDLYQLKKNVAERGGYQKVCDGKGWAGIGRSMGYSRNQCTSLSNSLKKAYTQIIMPYEHWLAKHKGRSSTPLQTDTKDENSDNDDDQDICVVCREQGNDDDIVICDDCDRAYHIFCVEPPLSTIPSNEWYCVHCLTGAIGDYGFEDGGEYSLPEFHAFCDKFKKNWFSKQRPVKTPEMVAEEDCEDEFWRLVDNPHETCQVEYGADLHSTQHGSGFAPIERGIDGVKGDDPWNLNMIPVLPSSLFTHIKTDISGMMVPWLYIGMCFSAFCWHNEDHFTYSINYMHWGETKTWYGVPGEDTTKFEDTMKKAVPELFEQQPNLLFQLVTMLSPGRLLKEKVRVYAVDQRPGEFVVTFPKAYHSGFNHGFNFCEAVNFAPMDWLNYGLECAKRYKAHRRQPCFSHDELLVNIAKMEIPKENVKWIKEALSDMQQRELGDRKTFKRQHPTIKQIMAPNDSDQEHLQCLACHCYTYLSYVTCSCTKKVACFEHVDELCKCKEGEKTVHLRFMDDELHSMVKMAGKQTSHSLAWQARTKSILSDDNLTTKEALQTQLKEARTEDIPKYCIMEVEKTLARIKQWEDQASVLLNPADETQPPTDSKQLKSKAKITPNGSKQLKNKKKVISTYNGTRYRGMLDLQKHAVNMSLKSPTLSQLKTRINETDVFKNQVQHLLSKDSNATLHDLESMFTRGQNQLYTDIEEMEPLLLALNQRRWLEILEPSVMQQLPLDYDAVTLLVKQAHEYKLPMTNPQYLSALSKAQLGEGWKTLAKRLLPSLSRKQVVTIDDLDEVLNIDRDVPVVKTLYQELDEFRTKVNACLLLFRRTMMQSKQQQLLHRPTAEDIHHLQDEMRKLPRPMIQNESATLDLELEHLTDWTTKVKKLLRPRYSQKKPFTDTLNDMRNSIGRILGQDASTISQNNKESENLEQQPTTTTTRDVYCICRQHESGVMIECSICHERFHGNCIKINRRKSKDTASYVCPMCDPCYDLQPFKERPTFGDFCDVMEEATNLKLVPRCYPTLYNILLKLTSYHDRLDAFCRSKQCVDIGGDKLMARKYLMELLGLPILFDKEMATLHKVLSPNGSVTQQQQQHEQQEPHHLDSGNQHQTHDGNGAHHNLSSLSSTATVTQSPPQPSLHNTNSYPTPYNNNNSIHYNSLSSTAGPLSLQDMAPATTTVIPPQSVPALHTTYDHLHHHTTSDRKRELSSSSMEHPNKRHQQDTTSNGYGTLSTNNFSKS